MTLNTFGDPPPPNSLKKEPTTPRLGEGHTYYKRLDVRRTITDFANARGSDSLRECAFYNSRAKSLQRYFNDGEPRCPVILDKPAELDRALAVGASAFYCSYWRYPGQDFSRPVGRDLVWTTRAKQGGLKFARAATVWILKALADAGVSEPWVKYSGDLGFDVVIPLETIPCEDWAGGADVSASLQEGLTNYIAGYLHERFPNVTVDGVTSPIEIKKGQKTCLLSELRARRGLLLAPMSLCPETGLVSVPVGPKQVGEFSIFDASPKNARAFEWVQPSIVARELVKHAHLWQVVPAQTKLEIA